MKNYFGVASGAKTVAERDQFLAQLDIIEYLAIEHDPGRIAFVRHRLLTGCEIDDGQARVRKPCPVIAIHPKLIRAAMVERAGHANQRFTAG